MLLAHARPFEDRVQARRSPASAASNRHWTGRRPKTACWCSACMAAWPRMANCRRCANCAAFPSPARARRRRISPSTRSLPSVLPRSRASRLRRRRAGRYRGGTRRAWQTDCKTGEGRIELRADFRQFVAGHRRGPQRGQRRRLSDRAFCRGRGSDLRRAGAVDGSVFSLPPIEIVPARRRRSTTAPNIWPKRPRRSAPGGSRLKSPRRSWSWR